ncbi:putative Ntn-hydrolase superfamily protein [Luteibacter sp. Sphag1AF]|uniref:DUF1028 domain-containing protein n=1 Tax=Luteibacter sp. Sphag1AF TaxID=2587031 RepID=UPI0017AB7FAB|nr:DUF1028 domain-containing protein [Luteibacter sp. Sphag1AF]MBB3225920.1 putative Ntn-hydrolase superfamily protein [Luteibacter sp. Sphag1AF]
MPNRRPARNALIRVLQLCGLVLLAIIPSMAFATFSIVACDRNGNCGVAVATNNLAVGASVPYAQARVGALVSQFETNPTYGPKGLALLSSGKSPDATLQLLLDGDGNFDGSTIAERQVGIVDARGRSATYSGTEALSSTWAGALHGDGYAIQGNGLAGEQVVAAMKQTFLSSTGTLAERLMASLEAGQDAGGQTIGKRSAALLVRTTDGAWQDIDLRVDAATEPVRDLRQLLDQHYALDAMIRAEHQAQKGTNDLARASVAQALHLSHGWDRIWRRAARLAMTMGDKDRARDYLAVFVSLSPVWGQIELKDDLYAPLHGDALFESWRKP